MLIFVCVCYFQNVRSSRERNKQTLGNDQFPYTFSALKGLNYNIFLNITRYYRCRMANFILAYTLGH